MHPLLIIGLLFNSALIVINRFFFDLGAFSIPCHLAAISLMVAGIILTITKLRT